MLPIREGILIICFIIMIFVSLPQNDDILTKILLFSYILLVFFCMICISCAIIFLVQ